MKKQLLILQLYTSGLLRLRLRSVVLFIYNFWGDQLHLDSSQLFVFKKQ